MWEAGVMSIYEKMLQDPKNRKVSNMKQPTPDRAEVCISDNITETKKYDPNEDFFAAVDRRIAEKKKNGIEITPPLVEETKVNTGLEKRVKDLEDLVTEMMKTQIKLINKLNE